MSRKATPPKARRIAELYARLAAAPCCSTLDEAFDLVCRTLNAVENELTDIPYNEATSYVDGRLYPPVREELKILDDQLGVTGYRHRSHVTFLGKNGAIEIRETQTDTIVFEKPGQDGKGVRQT